MQIFPCEDKLPRLVDLRGRLTVVGASNFTLHGPHTRDIIQLRYCRGTVKLEQALHNKRPQLLKKGKLRGRNPSQSIS